MQNAKVMLEKQRDRAVFEMEAAGARADALENQIKFTSLRNGMEVWLGFKFESSCGLTREFAAFNRDFRSWVKKNLSEGARLVSWNRGHFYCSGFIERAGKFVYFSCSDVRSFRDEWHDNLLIRTAKHDKDYRGGGNCWTKLPAFRQDVGILLDREVRA